MRQRGGSMSGTVQTKTITKPWSHVSNLEEHNAWFSCRITWGFSSQPLPPMARGDHVGLHKKRALSWQGNTDWLHIVMAYAMIIILKLKRKALRNHVSLIQCFSVLVPPSVHVLLFTDLCQTNVSVSDLMMSIKPGST